MLCETAREQLNTLSDGERLETVQQKILLWRHCARCPACRAARRQLKQMRQTARHLPALLPASLCGRILSQLPAEILLSEILPSNDSAFTRATGTSINTKEITRRKRLTLAACIALVLAVTGTLTAQLLSQKAGFTVEDRNGHVWHIASDYRGEVRLYDPQGKFIGSTRNSQPSATLNGTVQLEVSGTHVSLHPEERQEVRDSRGAILGYAQLISISDAQHQKEIEHRPHSLLEALRQSEVEEQKVGGVSGISASPLGANGWNKQIGVSWKVRGAAAVTALDASGQSVGQANSCELTMDMRKQLPPDMRPATPRIEVTVNGKTYTEQGFGRHLIKNDKGTILMQLNVQPLSTIRRSDIDKGKH